MLKNVLIAILVVIICFLGYVAIQPADYEISREITIATPPDVIFPYINNTQKANRWMPWFDNDPNLKINYTGPEEGIGSASNWVSTGPMGVGETQIIESVLNEAVKTKLTYKEPMTMEQTASLTLTPAESSTVVRWSVVGKNNFIGRLMCVFMDMDEMVGAEFEKGLAKLKTIAESSNIKASNE